MNKFPSFRSAPKPAPLQAPQEAKVPAPKSEPNLFYDDSKGDPEFFRYGKFKEKIEYGRSFDDSPNGIFDEIFCPNQERSNLAVKLPKIKPVDFIVNDEALRKRLDYCIEKDLEGNIFFHSEISSLSSSAHQLELHNTISTGSAIDLINWVLEDFQNRKQFLRPHIKDHLVKRVILQEESLEQCPNNDPIYYYRLISGDFSTFHVRDLLSSIPLKQDCYFFYLKLLFESGRSEKYIDNIQDIFDFRFDRPQYEEFPINIPQQMQDKKSILKEWKKTEKERDWRFFYPLDSNEKILIDDPLEDDPERVYPLEAGIFEIDRRNLYDFLQTDFHGIDSILSQINAKFKFHTENSDFETLTKQNRDQLLQINLKDPFDEWQFEEFCRQESLCGYFFRIRKWLAHRFFHDIKFYPIQVVQVSKILRCYFYKFNQRELFEAALEVNRFSSILWIQYLNVAEESRAANLFCRAITTIPFCKEIYLKGIDLNLAGIEGLHLVQLMEEKGIRLRTFLEEFEP
jgi:hypothetical protein